MALILPYLHHEDHRVERDHDEHRVLERGRGHKVPQSVLEGLSVLRHVAGHRLGADGEVDARPLMERNETRQTRTTEEGSKHLRERVFTLPHRTSFFSRLHS